MKKNVAFHNPPANQTISQYDVSPEEEIEEPTEIQMRSNVPGSHATRSHFISTAMAAVQLKQVFKHYGIYKYWRQVLTSFSMTVMPGEIYTLIGPKGCGKTTVLNIILGLEAVDKGDVTIFGYSPRHKHASVYGGKVGYMPQNPGLHAELTIIETLQYYSTILGLDEQYAFMRITFLLKSLSLAKEKKLIGKLSEGQRQRVSFAIAVLHEPKILLLDEPTSTADPILRHSIWLHLHNMSSTLETAIIVTTHYVEEGRQSHRVGIMRNGKILADDDPNILIDKYAAYSLESVIYTLIALEMDSSASGNQAAMSLSLSPDDIRMFEENLQKPYPYAGTALRTQIASVVDLILDRQDYNYPPFTDLVDGIVMRCQALSCPSFRRSRAILCKDIRIILRNKLKLLRAVTFPCIFIIVFCLTIGPMPKNLLFGVVNMETNPDTCEDQPKNYTSCQFLAMIDKDIIHQAVFADEEKARAAAMRSQVYGVMIIGKNFSLAFEDKILKENDEPILDGDIEVAIYETAREDQLQTMSKHTRQHRDHGQQVHAFETLDQPDILYPEGEEEELTDINMSNEQFQRAQQAMNIDQRQLFNFTTDSIKDQINGDKKRERIPINGGAGTGKTVLFNVLKNKVNWCYGKKVVKVGALTGVAARLVGGSTLHRLLILPVQKDGVIVNMPLLSDMQTTFVVHDALLYAIDKLLEEMRAEYGNKVDRADSLIQITGPVLSDRSATHTYFMAPGLVICFTFYQAAAALALSLIRERIAQRMVRNYVAGAANVEIVTSHIITYIPLILVHMGLLLVGLFFILNVPLRGQVLEVINLMLMQGIAGIAFGHVISYFCDTELQGMKVILCACFISIAFCVLCFMYGIVWPITVMPHWMQKTVSAFPQTDASSELRKALTCGSIYKLGLFQGLIVPAIWTVILFAISSVLHIL